MTNRVEFEVGKVYIGEQYHSSNGHVLSTGLFLCTKIWIKKTKWCETKFASLRKVYSVPVSGKRNPTFTRKVYTSTDTEKTNAGHYGEYTVYAMCEHIGDWYENDSKNKED